MKRFLSIVTLVFTVMSIYAQQTSLTLTVDATEAPEKFCMPKKPFLFDLAR